MFKASLRARVKRHDRRITDLPLLTPFELDIKKFFTVGGLSEA